MGVDALERGVDRLERGWRCAPPAGRQRLPGCAGARPPRHARACARPRPGAQAPAHPRDARVRASRGRIGPRIPRFEPWRPSAGRDLIPGPKRAGMGATGPLLGFFLYRPIIPPGPMGGRPRDRPGIEPTEVGARDRPRGSTPGIGPALPGQAHDSRRPPGCARHARRPCGARVWRRRPADDVRHVPSSRGA